MKTIQNKKTWNVLKIPLLGATLALLIILSANAFATNNSTSNAVITVNGNDGLRVNKLQLAPNDDTFSTGEELSSVQFNIANLNFRLFGSSVFDNLTVLGESLFENKIYVGFDSPSAAQSGGNNAELQIDGVLTIQELKHQNCLDTASCAAIADEKLCVIDFGVLQRCGSSNIDTDPVTAQPGSCQIYTSEYSSQPATNNASACQIGTYQNGSDTDTTWNWNCLGVDGGATLSCSADKLIILDPIGIGGRTSGSLNLKETFAGLFSATKVEASSSICSERNNLNQSGVYKRTGSVFIRDGETLTFLAENGEKKAIDYSFFANNPTLSSSVISIYVDDNLSSKIADGEYLISGDDVINELRDPLSFTDGIEIPHGTPVSAISMVVYNDNYTFEACDETLELSNDEIRVLDVVTIKQQLENYYTVHGKYPSSGGATLPNGSWSATNNSSWNTFATNMSLARLPADPLNRADGASSWTDDYTYKYYSGDYGCGDHQWYMLHYSFEDKTRIESLGAEACNRDFNYGGNGITTGECKSPYCDSTWDSSDWGACNGVTGIQTRNVLCLGTDGTTTSDANCWEQQKPDVSRSCIINAVCENVPGSFDTQPVSSTSEACQAGTYTDTNDERSKWNWRCNGLNGGTNAACSAVRITYDWNIESWGVCNNTNGIQTRAVVCKSSLGTTASDTRCSGTKPALTQNCAVAGSCKDYKNSYETQPATNSSLGCNQGIYANSTNLATQWRWQCSGLNGGKASPCSATRTTYAWETANWGVCNNTNGIQTRTALCRASTGVVAADSKCSGTKPALTQNCAVAGTCKTIVGSHETQPATNSSLGCNQGIYANSTNLATQWRWQCSGLNGGTPSSCSATRTTYTWHTGLWGVCNLSSGIQTRSVQCRTSTGLVTADSKCSATKPALTQNCAVAGTCKKITGSYENQPATSTLTACARGTYTNNSNLATQWRWFCTGLSGGATSSCSAIRTTYAWEAGTWGLCPSGTQTRNVVCRASTGSVVTNGKCSGTAPISSQSCLTNDEIRANDFVIIQAELEKYYSKNGKYPTKANYGTGSAEPGSTWANSKSTKWSAIESLMRTSLPRDPINTAEGSGSWTSAYRYHYYSNSYGCDGQWYMLYYNPEGVTNPPTNTLKSCSYNFKYGGLTGVGKCKSPACNSVWQTGSWGSCSASGSQTRTVTCNDSNGNVTSDGNCSGKIGAKPATLQNCALNASCKAYTSSYTSQPATTTSAGCNLGTYANVSDTSTNYKWQCVGINGGTNTTCSAKKKLNGMCGSTHTKTYSTRPTASCTTGSAAWTDSSGADGKWNWTCGGVNGGSAVSCYANRVLSASCKSYTSSYTSQPATATSNACNIGTYTNLSDASNKWNWRCNGVNGGTAINCSAIRTTYTWLTGSWGTCSSLGSQTRTVTCKASTGGTVSNSLCTTTKPATSQKCPITGSCKAYTSSYTSQPATTTVAGCNRGTYANLSNTSTAWKWKCNGLNSGAASTCSAKIKRNGICKSYTSSYTSQPATSTSTGCSTGSYGNVSNTSTAWKWSCSGINGGLTTTCSALIKKNGVCKTYAASYTQPATSTSTGCSTGSYGNVSNTSTTWKWSCSGVNGGVASTCSVPIKKNAVCNNATRNGCTVGTANDGAVSDTSTLYRWRCDGISGGSNTGTCQKTKDINAVCKPYTGTYSSQPATTTSTGCTAGTYSDLADKFAWSWRCNGIGNGLDVNCSANKLLAVNGSCKSYTSTYSSQPAYSSSTGCLAGSYSDTTDTKFSWDWQCQGSNGGLSSICSADKKILLTNGQCKKYTSIYYTQPATSTSTGCITGTYINNSDTTTSFRWSCGNTSGSTASCSAEKDPALTCFVSGTKVQMADGTFKNIEDVNIGEMILGGNGEKSIVKGLHMPLLGEGRSTKLYSFNGGRYFVTAEHPFKTTTGWKAIDPAWSMEEHNMTDINVLGLGDILITENGEIVIETIDSINGEENVQLYNLMLGGNHTYYADGYLVHNKKLEGVK